MSNEFYCELDFYAGYPRQSVKVKKGKREKEKKGKREKGKREKEKKRKRKKGNSEFSVLNSVFSGCYVRHVLIWRLNHHFCDATKP